MPDKSELIEFSTNHIADRDNEVLQFILAEELSGFTFDGVRKRLHIHPETLSRILSRLEEMDLIKRAAVGYQVNSKAYEFMAIPLSENSSNIQILQTYLSMNSSIDYLLLELQGKWFNSLRWLGYSKKDENITFKWITSDSKAQINAVIWDNTLNIEAILLKDTKLDTILASAHNLFGFMTRTIQNLNNLNNESLFNHWKAS